MTWNETDPETIDEPTEFGTDVDGLEPDTEYEYRAVATAGDETVKGNTETIEMRPEGTYLLAFIADNYASGVKYRFHGRGDAEFTLVEDYPAPGHVEGGTWQKEDFIDDTDEGYEAGGGTGNGNGDAYWVHGTIDGIEMDDGLNVELDRERMEPDDVIEATQPDDEEPDPDPPDDRDEYIEELEAENDRLRGKVDELERQVDILETERDDMAAERDEFEALAADRKAAIENAVDALEDVE